jgi:hypothetical protein
MTIALIAALLVGMSVTLVMTEAVSGGATGDTTWYACLKGGKMSQVGTTPPGACKTPMSWNSQGPQGPIGPTGDTGAVGPQGPQGPPGPKSLPDFATTEGGLVSPTQGGPAVTVDTISVPAGHYLVSAYGQVIPADAAAYPDSYFAAGCTIQAYDATTGNTATVDQVNVSAQDNTADAIPQSYGMGGPQTLADGGTITLSCEAVAGYPPAALYDNELKALQFNTHG